jgi:hypothetical protein
VGAMAALDTILGHLQGLLALEALTSEVRDP